MNTIQVLDCRVCGDPYSHLRFAFVEFADESKKPWTVDNDLALKIYIKARATPIVVAAFAERREFDKIMIYSNQVGVTLIAAI